MTIENDPAIEPANEPKPKPKPKRRYTRRVYKPRVTRAAAPAETGELAGLSPTDCCEACYEAGICCISGDVCVHPFKGGLQSKHQMNPDVVRRFSRAKRMLRHQKIELQDRT